MAVRSMELWPSMILWSWMRVTPQAAHSRRRGGRGRGARTAQRVAGDEFALEAGFEGGIEGQAHGGSIALGFGRDRPQSFRCSTGT
jgi:hypothetical protein